MASLESFLVHNIWLVIALWAAVYISDYALTLVGARMYYAGAGPDAPAYEMNSLLRRDIAGLRHVSPRFLIMLLLTSASIWFLWWLQLQKRWTEGPGPLLFWVGALLFIQVAAHWGHLKNIYLMERQRRKRDPWDRIPFGLSAIELWLMAGFCLLLFLSGRSMLLLGGTLACAVGGMRFGRKGR